MEMSCVYIQENNDSFGLQSDAIRPFHVGC